MSRFDTDPRAFFEAIYAGEVRARFTTERGRRATKSPGSGETGTGNRAIPCYPRSRPPCIAVRGAASIVR